MYVAHVCSSCIQLMYTAHVYSSCIQLMYTAHAQYPCETCSKDVSCFVAYMYYL